MITGDELRLRLFQEIERQHKTRCLVSLVRTVWVATYQNVGQVQERLLGKFKPHWTS